MAVSENQFKAPAESADAFASDDISVSKNGFAVPLGDLRAVSIDSFRSAITGSCRRGTRLVSLFLLPAEKGTAGELLAVLADDKGGRLGLVRGMLPSSRSYESLTKELPQAQLFERELYENHGIVPEGHPWLKPVRRHADLEDPKKGSESAAPPHEFFRVEGEGIHEVAVGPVHAGVIEPGHFRFQCYGETVLSLEIQLGYQHRGAEKLMLSAPKRRIAIAETIAGDTTMGHGIAYCQTMEGLSGAKTSLYSQAVRAVALELERCANHIGDLGALCGDVGHLPGLSWFGRLRGDFLNLSMELCGSRFGRGLVKPGGVRFGLSAEQRKEFLSRLAKAGADLKMIADLVFDTPSIGSRFERTGIVDKALAEEIGLVGPAARASGCDRDVRRDHSTCLFRFSHIPVARVDTGDVMARAIVRWLESERSVNFICEQLEQLEEGPLSVNAESLAGASLIVSLVEGWRGEIAHIAVTDDAGALVGYKIVDPSFHNWFGLAMALRDNQISDFPLCNKSFNLSYAGHDL